MDSDLEKDKQALEGANKKVEILDKKLEKAIIDKMQYEENLNMAIWANDKAKEVEERQKIDNSLVEIEALKKELERKKRDAELAEILFSITEKKAKEENIDALEGETETNKPQINPRRHTSKLSIKSLIYKPQHIKGKTQKGKGINKRKNLLNRPKKVDSKVFTGIGIKKTIKNVLNESKKWVSKVFTGVGIKKKIQALSLAALVGISSSASMVKNNVQSVELNDTTNSIEEFTDNKSETIKEISRNAFAELMNGEKIELKTEISQEEASKEEHKSNESNINLDRPIEETIQNAIEVDVTREDQIKKIYGGEISASENGIRTEEDILFAVTQMGWSKNRIENIKEMMPGLLKMQIDFDIDPLCALAVFQWESGCGTEYDKKYGQIRVANIRYWTGEKGVIGYSKTEHYGLYKDFPSAAYDFGNYVRNGTPYIASPALTMADLKSHNGYTCIFNGADKEGLFTYNQLKKCLEKRITVDDILTSVNTLRLEEFKEMTNTIKSNSGLKNIGVKNGANQKHIEER